MVEFVRLYPLSEGRTDVLDAQMAVFFVWFGLKEEHQEHCAKQLATVDDPEASLGTIAKSYLILPNGDPALVKIAADAAIKNWGLLSEHPYSHWIAMEAGMGYYRLGVIGNTSACPCSAQGGNTQPAENHSL